MRRFHTRDQEKPDVKNTCLEAATSFTIQSRSQAINGHCIQKVQATSHPMEIGLQLTVYMPAGLPERFGGSKLRSNPLFSGDFAMFHVSQAKTIIQFSDTVGTVVL